MKRVPSTFNVIVNVVYRFVEVRVVTRTGVKSSPPRLFQSTHNAIWELDKYNLRETNIPWRYDEEAV